MTWTRTNLAEEYYNSGLDKFQAEDYYSAIADFTKALEFGEYSIVYYFRAGSKAGLGDDAGAILDFNQAISLEPDDPDYYFDRANSKFGIKDFYGAISDYTKCIEISPNDYDAYQARGDSKKNLGDSNGSCDDWRKAAEIQNIAVPQWVENECN